MVRSPILVTGSTRSGTTWIGRMLCESREAAYVNEPFNPVVRPRWTRTPIPRNHLYIDHRNEGAHAGVIDDVMRLRYPLAANLKDAKDAASVRIAARAVRDFARSIDARRRRARPLLKDPFALFSAEWLHARYGAEVVVVIRHPAGVISSVRRLGWSGNVADWVAQPGLLDDLVAPYADDLRRASRDPGALDAIDHGILAWNACYSVVARYRERHPNWRYVRYEDASEAPIEAFRELYASLALTWSDAVQRRVREFSAASNPAGTERSAPHAIKLDSRAASRSWRERLSADEIERIREGTRDVWPAFYSAEDWLATPTPSGPPA